MKKNISFPYVLGLTGLALLLGGCGGAYYQNASGAKSMVIPGTQGPIPSTSEGSSGATGGDSAPLKGVPPYNFEIRGTGYTSVSVRVQANQTLRVQFLPGVQDRNVAGTGFSAQYSRMGVYIKVGSQSQPTEMLSNGLYDGNAEKSRILEFSNSFERVCDRTDSNCRQEITITIEKPNYDYYCLIGYLPGCPWSHVWETHPWNGTLLVQTEDTDPLSKD